MSKIASLPRRSVVITLGCQFSIQLIGLATGILVARSLGPSGRGELASIIAGVSMLVYLGNLGLPMAYTYAAARDPDRMRQLLGNGFLAALIQWPMLILIGSAVLTPVLSGQSEQTRFLAVLYLCMYVPLNLLTLYANAIQQGLGQYGGFNAVRLCVPASYLVGLGVLLALDNLTVARVLGANLFSNVAALTLSLVLVLAEARRRGRSHSVFNLAALRRDARYGISAHLGTVQPFNGLQIDVLLLSLLLATHDLGLYVAALAGASLIRAQGLALGMIVLPEVAKRASRDEQRKIIVHFGGFAVLLGVFTAVIGFVWAEPLIKLVYGEAFTGAASILRVLVLAGVAASLYRVLADGLRGMGYPIRATMAEVVSMAVGVPAIFALVPWFGALGAALGLGMASLAALAVALPPVLSRRSPPIDNGQLAERVRLAMPASVNDDTRTR